MIDELPRRKYKPRRKRRDNNKNFLPDLSQDKQPMHGTIPPVIFEPPEVVAARDEATEAHNDRHIDETINLAEDTPAAPSTPLPVPTATPKNRGPKAAWHRFTRWFSRLKPWQQLVCGLLLVGILTGTAAAAYLALSSEEPQPVAKQTTQVRPTPEPVPTTVPSTLTGRQVAPEINQRQVTGVMIENSMDARPQGGLQQAGVVFEAIAEGGITRFLALFQDTDADAIGPVRSVRPYYISWARGFDAAIAHVGGSPEALKIMSDQNVKNLDHNTTYMHRVTYRYAPHNVFTSTALLRQYQDSRGYTSSSYTGFARATTTGKPASPITAGNIAVNISSQNYASSYTYDPATNKYTRSEGGALHTDITTKTAITPDVVIVMVVNYSIHADGIHSVYGTVGGGDVYVFQNGGVTTGKWAKTSDTAQLTFTDGSGKPILLNPGQTWVTSVSGAAKVSYTP